MPELAETPFNADLADVRQPRRRPIFLDLDPTIGESGVRAAIEAGRDAMRSLRGLGTAGAVQVRDLVSEPRRATGCARIELRVTTGMPVALDVIGAPMRVICIRSPWSASVSTVPAAIPEVVLNDGSVDDDHSDLRAPAAAPEDPWGVRSYRIAKAARAFLQDE